MVFLYVSRCYQKALSGLHRIPVIVTPSSGHIMDNIGIAQHWTDIHKMRSSATPHITNLQQRILPDSINVHIHILHLLVMILLYKG